MKKCFAEELSKSYMILSQPLVTVGTWGERTNYDN